MGSYCIRQVQRLPISIDTAWDFFSSPANLDAITPTHMKMMVTSNTIEDKMYAGQIITYSVRPILGIPLFWMTEITHVKDHEYFIDNQRHGPFALWHHTHRFKVIEGGVEMTDIVNYKLPLGPLGAIAHALFVKKQVESIFAFRLKKLEKLFGKL